MIDAQKIWQAVLGELEVTLSKANFTTWFKHTALESVDGEVAKISVPNAFTERWLKNKYLEEIVAVLSKHIPEVKKVEFVIGKQPAAGAAQPEVLSAAPASEAAAETESDLTSSGALTKNTFENFIVGNSTRLAYAAAKAVTKNPGGTYNPLFLYGGAGLGKTHLMQAIGREVSRTSDKKVVYAPTEKLMNEFIAALSQNRAAQFKNRYRKVDLLLVDDVQFLAGKETFQEEFFHTFNTLHQAGAQIVLTSDRPPKAIPTLEDRLRSRLEWGMVADFGPPELETRIAILQTKAKERRYQVSSDVLDFIAKAVQQNIRELEGALIRVMAHAELSGEPATPQLAESVLGTMMAARTHRQVSTMQIIEAVSRFYDVSVEELRGPRRQKEIVKPRQLTMFLLREEANLSYPKIGRELGGRDHTTVIHAVEKIAGQTEIDEPLRHELNLIKERLYA